METISVVLILLLAVVVSGSLARMMPIAVPLPLFQIAIGVIIASVADLEVALNPEVFFLLLLPPLLFLDGWRIPKEGLFRDKGTIIELALGLVVFTVVGVGFFIHWLIPSMPLPVAFALAAIVSPTDPIAVSAIAAKVPIPKRLMHILEGESLLNDASGLVCMRFAVAAALTGSFSFTSALGTFIWLASGGIVIGICVTWGTALANRWISRHFGEETGSQILISLLIPFAAYLIAEHLHCSGILAAVAAGMTMSYVELYGQSLVATRMRRGAVWDMVQFAANGIIFVLLGEQIPHIVAAAANVSLATENHGALWLLLYVAAITLALAVLRFAWVWTSLRFTLFRAARQGKAIVVPSWRLVVAASLAGVRGAITLAGVLTLPLTLTDGTPFPSRDLAIFLAAGVIVLSLIAASIGLPRLLKGLELPPEASHQEAEDQARIAAAEAAIRAIERTQHQLSEGRSDSDLFADASGRLMEHYRQRIDGRLQTGEEAELMRRIDEIERQLRLAGIRAERNEIIRSVRARELSDEVARKLVRELDLLEARFAVG
jgi:Na+/H+ antiporter